MVLVHVDLATGDVTRDASRPDPFTDDGPIAALRAVRRWLHRTEGACGSSSFDPADAPIALVTGAVGGFEGPGLARIAAVGVSPLSGGVAETRAEGPFARGMRRTGVSSVVLHGRAVAPMIVVVAGASARLEPADDVWGLETGPATDALLTRFGQQAAIAVIGPAGENGVRYASIVTCRDHQLPRLGLGAVLGGKNVKAVVCIGGASSSSPDLSAFVARYAEAIPGNQLAAWQHGAPGFAVWDADPGYVTVANFRDTAARGGIEATTAPPMEGVAACPGCPNDCMKRYAGAALHQEALAMLGRNIGYDDPWTLHARCVQLGLDPVSLGGTLAAYGMPPGQIRSAVEDIAVGLDPYHLGEGAARLAASGWATDAAMTSKRVEMPPFDPRVQPNLGLACAVSPIGPRYDIAEHDLDFVADGLTYAFDEARLLGLSVPRVLGNLDPAGTAALMRLWSGLDALGICLFAATPTRPLRLCDVEDLVEFLVGTRPDVLALGGLRLRLQRDVNQRLGIGLDQDVLPDRFFDEPVAAGPWAGAALDRTAFAGAVRQLQKELEFDSDLEEL